MQHLEVSGVRHKRVKDKPGGVNMSKLSLHVHFQLVSSKNGSQHSAVSAMARLWAVCARNHGTIPNGSEEFITSKSSDQIWGPLRLQ